jgi:hypothetical protein
MVRENTSHLTGSGLLRPPTSSEDDARKIRGDELSAPVVVRAGRDLAISESEPHPASDGEVWGKVQR